MANTTITRRNNVLTLYQDFAEQELRGGAPAKGLEQAFAAKLEVSPSLWSMLKSSRPISDKMARQIEHHCGKPAGWLDIPQESAVPSPAEQRFLDAALLAWRSTNAEGRRKLRKAVAQVQVETEAKVG